MADTLEILGPASPVPPEGFSVAVVRRDAQGALLPLGEPTVTAEGAELKPSAPVPSLASWLVAPRPGARTVTVRARAGALEAEQRYVLGPPATEVALALEPAAPVKGRDKEATLTVRVLRPDGTPDDTGAPPVLRASTGRIEDLARTGPGVYRARYVLPTTRFPEVAILVALSAWPSPQSIHGAFGRVLVPLAASVELPGTTEPDAEIAIDIAGQRFGPARAGPDGRFRLPVIVPPGHRYGLGHVTDRLGNVRRTPIDLMLPPTDGLACVLNPQRLPADGASRARVLCATSDVFGRPVLDAQVTAQARFGSLEGPHRAEGGLLEWFYTAPRGLPAEPESIEAVWPQPAVRSREALALQLVQGPAVSTTLTVARPVAHYGSSVPVSVEARDALGRPRPEAQVVLDCPVGECTPVREEQPGVFASTWNLQPSGTASEVEVVARAFGPAGTEPARLSVWYAGRSLHAGVSDLAGLPVPGQPLRSGGKTFVTGADGTVALGPVAPGAPVEVVHEVWPGLSRTLYVLGPEGPVFPVDAPLTPAPVKQRVRLAPRAPVSVRLVVRGARVTYWVEDEKGRVLPDRRVYVWQSAGTRGKEEVREGRHAFTVEAPGPVSLSVADVETGVTAFQEVRP
ncbi:hypothetical protein P2318_13700 [Myxococcaceae bacterium GXIMD 01537]